MPVTTVDSAQIRDGTVSRADLNTTTVGQSVVAKLIQGTNVSLSSTGADAGTGDVTISVPTGGQGPAGTPAWTTSTASFTVPAVGSTVTVNVVDTSWMTVGELLWIQDANGVGAAGALKIQSKTSTSVTLLNLGTGAADTMLKSVYDTNNDGIADHAALADTAPWSGITGKRIASFQGVDNTNTNAYAITVNSDFQLVSGAMVFFQVSNLNSAANPTLNVNSTGAIQLTNKAAISLLPNEIGVSRFHGAIYDGTNWRIFTKLSRVYTATNPGNVILECLGFDAVAATVVFSTAAASTALTLAHLEPGIDLSVNFQNTSAGACTYSIPASNWVGGVLNTYWIWANAVTGVAAVIISNAQTVNAGSNFYCRGTFHQGLGVVMI